MPQNLLSLKDFPAQKIADNHNQNALSKETGPFQWVISIRPCIQHPMCHLRVIEGGTAALEIQKSSKMSKFKGQQLILRNRKATASWLQVYQRLRRSIRRDLKWTKIIQLSIRPIFHKATRNPLLPLGLLVDQELPAETSMGPLDLRVKQGMIWFQLKYPLEKRRSQLRNYQIKSLDLAQDQTT